jgi:hypothetical protein
MWGKNPKGGGKGKTKPFKNKPVKKCLFSSSVQEYVYNLKNKIYRKLVLKTFLLEMSVN